MAEIRDLKNDYPSPSSGFPLLAVFSNRYPLTAITFV